MRVGTALLCDFAAVRDSLLFVVGGGVNRLYRDEYPAPMGVSLALVFEVHQMEAAHPHEIDVRVVGEDGAELARMQGGFQTNLPPGVHVGEEILVPVGLDLRDVGLQTAGAYSIEISVDGTHHRTVQFWVEPRPTLEAQPG
jgi:uncharacterized protein DUF6941